MMPKQDPAGVQALREETCGVLALTRNAEPAGPTGTAAGTTIGARSRRAARAKRRWGLAIDLKRCIGCQSCTMACKAENGTPPGIFWTQVIEKEEGKYPFAYKVFMPLRCNHCSDPPCVPVCPTGATYVREQDNLVLVDQDKCVGCHSCVVSCPYQARSMAENARGYYGEQQTPYEAVAFAKWQPHSAQKCTMCVDRIDQGLKPACVETCPTQALVFGDLNDPDSPASKEIAKRPNFQPHIEIGTDPNTYYLT